MTSKRHASADCSDGFLAVLPLIQNSMVPTRSGDILSSPMASCSW
jgi:hypothetical protein